MLIWVVVVEKGLWVYNEQIGIVQINLLFPQSEMEISSLFGLGSVIHQQNLDGPSCWLVGAVLIVCATLVKINEIFKLYYHWLIHQARPNPLIITEKQNFQYLYCSLLILQIISTYTAHPVHILSQSFIFIILHISHH